MKKSVLTIMIIAVMTIFLTACGSKGHNAWRLGDYKGEYIGFRLEDADSEKPIVVVRFEFTNYGNEAISFLNALKPALYQTGVELIRISDEVDSASRPVPPGETHVIDMQYYLESKSELMEITITNSLTGESYGVKTHCEQ